MSEFENKVVIVTGGAKGIGRAISLAFAKAGANVASADVDVAAGQAIELDAAELAGQLAFYAHNHQNYTIFYLRPSLNQPYKPKQQN